MRNPDETTGCHSNQPCTITIHETLSHRRRAADDFLGVLLGGSDSSSAPASPLWSPGTTDSGINEDAPVDPRESLHPPSCSVFTAFDTQAFPQLPLPESQPPPHDRTTDVYIDLGWESDDLQEPFGIAHYLTTSQPSTQTLTVKDLLLTSPGQKALQISQHSSQELVLNEEEKKLLVKEGVNLPNKLPLSKFTLTYPFLLPPLLSRSSHVFDHPDKFEERVLKKIRRKIRNKHSAQESRKKKREYVDSLEARMSACGAHNLKLQRKMQQLEETNNDLLEQLSRLQALLPNSSSKTRHRGTCLLVLLLSFSLIISSNLQPEPYSQPSQGEYTQTKVPSRALQSMDEVRDVAPVPLFSISRGVEAVGQVMEKL
ncbi:Cyclic AMP-responsive element-binding protein 3-like protein 3-A [Liparis tanakae]|uniref:Cyclic AMP-responsive element-binding protein 3-like protein 3-A n=1 Tax=Liparis tanakae TaxID=230148 RepID=A0A4Z2IJF9_9TELE|nr:Cyclic AMP-responsive element-binding protein 3-like protein 3-A [Liparis tanakae]